MDMFCFDVDIWTLCHSLHKVARAQTFFCGVYACLMSGVVVTSSGACAFFFQHNGKFPFEYVIYVTLYISSETTL